MVICRNCKHHWVQSKGSHYVSDRCLVDGAIKEFSPVNGWMHRGYHDCSKNKNGDCPQYEKKMEVKKSFFEKLFGK